MKKPAEGYSTETRSLAKPRNPAKVSGSAVSSFQFGVQAVDKSDLRKDPSAAENRGAERILSKKRAPFRRLLT